MHLLVPSNEGSCLISIGFSPVIIRVISCKVNTDQRQILNEKCELCTKEHF